MSIPALQLTRKDKPFVQRLFDALQSAGRDVWADWADIPASADWFAEIRTGIESAGGAAHAHRRRRRHVGR